MKNHVKYLSVEHKTRYRRWIAALRSGEYRQTTDYHVAVVDGHVCHCAMGVLFQIEGLVVNDHPTGIPRVLGQPRNFIHADQYIFTVLNDVYRLTLAEIADYLEHIVEHGDDLDVPPHALAAIFKKRTS